MAKLIPDDPQQKKYLGIAVAALILIYPFHAFYYSGQREEVTASQTRLEALQDQNRRAQVLAARGGGDLEERMALYERHVSELEQLIPAAEEVAGLLDDISSRARTSRVELSRMIPEPAETGAFYTRTSYEMSVIGEYHNVGRFLTEIASLPRIVTPVEMDVTLFDRPEIYPEYVFPVVAGFRIETFVLPEAAPPAPAQSGGAS